LAQKSLPILNKVNTSMIWYSTYYFKHYKWLSSQYVYLLCFFNKLLISLDFFFDKLLWIGDYRTQLYTPKRCYVTKNSSKVRFYKPLTSYLVNLNNKLVVFNVFYKTTLEKFQSLSSSSKIRNYTKIKQYKDYSKNKLLWFSS